MKHVCRCDSVLDSCLSSLGRVGSPPVSKVPCASQAFHHRRDAGASCLNRAALAPTTVPVSLLEPSAPVHAILGPGSPFLLGDKEEEDPSPPSRLAQGTESGPSCPNLVTSACALYSKGNCISPTPWPLGMWREVCESGQGSKIQ